MFQQGKFVPLVSVSYPLWLRNFAAFYFGQQACPKGRTSRHSLQQRCIISANIARRESISLRRAWRETCSTAVNAMPLHLIFLPEFIYLSLSHSRLTRPHITTDSSSSGRPCFSCRFISISFLVLPSLLSSIYSHFLERERLTIFFLVNLAVTRCTLSNNHQFSCPGESTCSPKGKGYMPHFEGLCSPHVDLSTRVWAMWRAYWLMRSHNFAPCRIPLSQHTVSLVGI